MTGNPMPPFSGRPVALVTGCSSGIGLRAVVALVRRGFHVTATMRDLSRRKDLDAAVEEVQGAEYVAVRQLDVLDQASIDSCVAGVLAQHGRIDVLVNNAGIGPPHFVEEATLADWRAVFETNLFGQIAVTNAVLPALRAQGGGRVVMLSSIGVRVPSPMLGVYSASKAALEGYAETLRLEAKPFGVRVYLLQPGAYRTEIYNSPLLTAPVPTGSAYADQFRDLQKFYVGYLTTSLRDPDEVAAAIVRAAVGRKRRLRYPVGIDAWIKLALRTALPWWYFERLVRKAVGLHP
ncbi:SDR family NAD(P)-dependent oxidoreductase [Actinoplanes sp. TFC3]|uniref:SDR family NAD(P)-dependent oxidoreductase n=1 Tax=Actinoplanes sp. TFC3 TaxID=1710355 RepID=UPI0009E91A0F|nr:SDR family NAD(P)-dependent oxidoreductase [Actinoplanes sp. TFC3]